MKRVPRKYKKKCKKLGLSGLYLWNMKYRNSIRGIIDFPSRRYLLSLLTEDKPVYATITQDMIDIYGKQ